MFQAAGSERQRSVLRRAEILPSRNFVARTSNSSLVSGPNRSVADSGRRWRRKKLAGTVGLAGIRSGAEGVVAADDRRQLPVRRGRHHRGIWDRWQESGPLIPRGDGRAARAGSRRVTMISRPRLQRQLSHSVTSSF
jgi:hypothetical protein